MSRRPKAVIVGTAQSEFARNIGRSEREILGEAALGALAEAGLTASDVDGLVSMTMDTAEEIDVARTIGLGDLDAFARISGGGGAGAAMVGIAGLFVTSGQAEVVLVYRARNRGSGVRPWAKGALIEYQAYTRPYGLVRPVDEVALWSRRYLRERGVSRTQLAQVPLTFRQHAHRNSTAIMRDRTLTLEDYLEARWVSEPLCLFDCSLESDGAVAFVVTTAERAADLATTPVVVESFAQGITQQFQPMMNLTGEDPLVGPGELGANRLWSRSEFGPEDVDVAQVYDVFSPLVLKTLEAYGLAPSEDIGGWVESGALAVDGAMPTNTSGGSLSEAYVHGMNLLSEGVRQVRGTAANQVPGAEVCFVSSAVCSTTSSLLLVKA